MKVAEVMSILEGEGWKAVALAGKPPPVPSSRRAGKGHRAGKRSDTLHPKTLASILRQAGIKR